ncbi:MAG: hypothetical protein Q9157_009067, partial [Trypethelium eluteriae]
YFSAQTRDTKVGAADPRTTDLSLIATMPTQSRWNAWWAALAPFPSLSSKARSKSSKREAKFRPSPPPSPMLPEAQESLLAPDASGSGSTHAGWWEVQEEQAEEEEERRREREEARKKREAFERRWMKRQKQAREYAISQGYVQ